MGLNHFRTMNDFENKPQSSPAETRPDIGRIEHMPEKTVAEILAKKKAFNDAIPVLSKLLADIGKPSMESVDSRPTDPLDRSIESENDEQESGLIVREIKHARDELVRLGDKEELELKKAA